MGGKTNNHSTAIEDCERGIVCIGCARVIPEAADFCPFCGAPVGDTVWMDPFKRIFAGGYVSRRFTSGAPRKWTMKVEIILGLILLPVNVAFLTHTAGLGDRVVAVLALVLSAALYYRLIRNFRRVYGKRGCANSHAASSE